MYISVYVGMFACIFLCGPDMVTDLVKCRLCRKGDFLVRSIRNSVREQMRPNTFFSKYLTIIQRSVSHCALSLSANHHHKRTKHLSIVNANCIAWTLCLIQQSYKKIMDGLKPAVEIIAAADRYIYVFFWNGQMDRVKKRVTHKKTMP